MLAGCSTPPEERLDAPVARIERLSLTGTTGTLALVFSNSNAVPLVVNSSTHTLYLGEKNIGIIDDAEPIGLPSQGTVTHTVTIPAKVTQTAQSYLQQTPGATRAIVKSSLEVATTADDSITLKTIARGSVTAP